MKPYEVQKKNSHGLSGPIDAGRRRSGSKQQQHIALNTLEGTKCRDRPGTEGRGETFVKYRFRESNRKARSKIIQNEKH